MAIVSGRSPHMCVVVVGRGAYINPFVFATRMPRERGEGRGGVMGSMAYVGFPI